MMEAPSKAICTLCFQESSRLLPIDHIEDTLKEQGFKFSLESIETLNYKAMVCSCCQSTDRARLVAHTLRQYLLAKEPRKTQHIHDMNPEKPLQDFCANHPQIVYTHGTLDVHKNNSLDVIICLHFLEHQQDDKSVITHMREKLKKEGEILAISPIVLSLKETLESKDYPQQSDKNKFLLLPQKHKRMYAKADFIKNFEKQKLQPKYYIYKALREKIGLSKAAVLYGFQK